VHKWHIVQGRSYGSLARVQDYVVGNRLHEMYDVAR